MTTRSARSALMAACCGLVLLALSGCAGLPTYEPVLPAADMPPVQLEGARGPLSAARSEAVLAQLQPESQTSDILQRHLIIEEAIAGSPLSLRAQPASVKSDPGKAGAS